MQPDQYENDFELLDLAEATDRTADAVTDATFSARIHEMATEVRGMAHRGRQSSRRSRPPRPENRDVAGEHSPA